MKTNAHKELLDTHIAALEAEQQKSANPFFYTHLMARMQQKASSTWLSGQPAWVFAALTLLLVINVAVLNRNLQKKKPLNENISNMENFGKTFNFIISNPYE